MIKFDFLFDADLQHHGTSGDNLRDAIDMMSAGARDWVTIGNVKIMAYQNWLEEFSTNHQGDNQELSINV